MAPDDDGIRGPPPIPPLRWPWRKSGEEGGKRRRKRRDRKSPRRDDDRRGRRIDDYA